MNPPWYRPRHRRRSRWPLAVAMIGLVGFALSGNAAAESARQANLSAGPRATYMVELAADPVAQSRAAGTRIDTADAQVREYQTELEGQRSRVLSRLANVDLLYGYTLTFNGFAANLTKAQVQALEANPRVRRVSRNETVYLRSQITPTYLGLTGSNGVWQTRFGGVARAGEGTIIGMIDSGIWPEHPSFAALPEPRPDAAAIAAKFKGRCDPGTTGQVQCNNKVIGARYFGRGVRLGPGEFQSPRDLVGHGTHTGAIAAGNANVAVPQQIQMYGASSGMAPAARISVYKACWNDGACALADLVAAVEQATADGVDVINFSIGGGERVAGPAEIAFYNAARAGIFIATAGGNEGPGTVTHQAPWLTTVAASTHPIPPSTLTNNAPMRAPQIPAFSSSGPSKATGGDLLKPDITAPGMNIIAASPPPRNNPQAGASFAAHSGTSMSAPHVAGVALLIKAKHPQWTPGMIKSAIMTTAVLSDAALGPITRAGAAATPLDEGAGHIAPTLAFDPGLVYDSTAGEWIGFVCAIGERQAASATCNQQGVAKADPSDLNSPSIAVGDLNRTQVVTRRVTNVSDKAGTYTVQVQAPPGFTVTVAPTTLTVAAGATATYKVTMTRGTAAAGAYTFGALTWSDGTHKVRSPIAVRAVA